jgi:FAD/FMN-containing dehydrogenase
VSLALTTLVDVNNGAGDWYIAVRSGGHNLAASNNIDNGVTIDLGLLDGATYDKSTNLASVGPGGKWMNVYALLEQYNVSVVGGRDGFVSLEFRLFEIA